MGQTNHSAAGPKLEDDGDGGDSEGHAVEEEHENEGQEHGSVGGEVEAEGGGGDGDHDHEADETGGEAGGQEPGNVLGHGDRGGEDVEEVARPDILKECGGDALHDAGHEVPEEDGAEQRRDEAVRGVGEGAEEFGHESPQNHVDGDPGEEGDDAGRAATVEIELAEGDGGDAGEVHDWSAPRSRGSRATLMKRSSRVVLPY